MAEETAGAVADPQADPGANLWADKMYQRRAYTYLQRACAYMAQGSQSWSAASWPSKSFFTYLLFLMARGRDDLSLLLSYAIS